MSFVEAFQGDVNRMHDVGEFERSYEEVRRMPCLPDEVGEIKKGVKKLAVRELDMVEPEE